MKIETMGKTLIAIGTAIMLYSRAMSVSANDSGIVNIYLMSERQNTLNFGGLLFIAGIVFFAVFKMKQTKEESNLDIERKRERSEQTKMRVDAALRKTSAGASLAGKSLLKELQHGDLSIITRLFAGMIAGAVSGWSLAFISFRLGLRFTDYQLEPWGVLLIGVLTLVSTVVYAYLKTGTVRVIAQLAAVSILLFAINSALLVSG